MAGYLRELTMNPIPRGFALEKLLSDVFEAFDLDPRGSFRLTGEQIDGGFTLGGEHFLLEAKWVADPSARDELDVFAAKVRRRGENTLGLSSRSMASRTPRSSFTAATVRRSC